jgi:TetR/AcrR family transcriptional regulator, fatty acid metabolism regulator protein
MQVRSEAKRRRICQAAADLFARRPYHEVLLSDVAAAAGVGKGTIYVYFPSKGDLYLAAHLEGLQALLERLEALVEETADPVLALSGIVEALVTHMFGSPQLLDVVRNVGAAAARAPFRVQHDRLTALIERVIHGGVDAGRFADARPDLTAVCVPGLVRSALLYGPKGLGADAVADHLLRLLLSALSAR